MKNSKLIIVILIILLACLVGFAFRESLVKNFLGPPKPGTPRYFEKILQEAISSIKLTDSTNYTTDNIYFLYGLSRIIDSAFTIDKYKKYQHLAVELKKEVVDFQKIYYSALRLKHYKLYSNSKINPTKIKAELSGENSSVLSLVWDAFQYDKVLLLWKKSYLGECYKMRFKKIIIKTSKTNIVDTVITDTPDDTKLVTSTELAIAETLNDILIMKSQLNSILDH